MPLTRIRQTAIGNDSITTAKLDDTSGGLTLPGVEYVKVPVGTTAQRPGSAAAGELRFNSDLGILEQWNTNTNSWQGIDSPPIISSVSYPSPVTAADPAGGETITLTGTNFTSGSSVTVGGTAASSVTLVNSTTITFTSPAKSAGDYDVRLTGGSGLAATLTNGISYNGTPSFTTASGNVGSVEDDIAMSTINIVATETDGGAITYAITTGALPTGVSMSSAGAITGTPNVNPTGNTDFNFTVTATDDENQTNTRNFILTVVRPVYTYEITQSLTFNDGALPYIDRFPSSDGNRKVWTSSFWIKRAQTGQAHYLWSGGAYSGNDGIAAIYINTDDKIHIYYDTSGSNPAGAVSAKTLTDTTNWYHIVWAVDAANTQHKIWVNGERWDTDTSKYPPNFDYGMNKSGTVSRFGTQAWGAGNYFDGYLAEMHHIDGQYLDYTYFAEEYNGVWIPKNFDVSTTPAASYGTNGFSWAKTTAPGIYVETDGKTPFGDMTGQSGLAAAFDGNVSTTYSNSAQATGSGYVGVDLGSGNEVALTGAFVYTTQYGILGSGGSTIDLQLWGSNTSPTSASDGTMIASTGAKADFSTNQGDFRCVAGSNSTAYRYIWVRGVTNTDDFFCSEVEFFKDGPSTVGDGWNTLEGRNYGQWRESCRQDSPTNNFPTWDSRGNFGGFTYSQGSNDINTNHPGNDLGCAITMMFPSTGKWYWEEYISISDSSDARNAHYLERESASYKTAGTVSTYPDNSLGQGNYFSFSCQSTSLSGPTVNSNLNEAARTNGGGVFAFAYDADNGQVWIVKDGAIDTSTTANVTGLDTGVPRIWVVREGSGTVSGGNRLNFGNNPSMSSSTTFGTNTDSNGVGKFFYAVPSGYSALCSKNIRELLYSHTLDNGVDKGFAAKTYTGNGTNPTTLTYDMAPDLFATKNVESGYNWAVYDTVRGALDEISFSTSNAANTETVGLTSFTSTGVVVGNRANMNENTKRYTSFAWKAGGAPTATNTGGQTPTSGSVMIDGVASTDALPSADIYPKKISVSRDYGFSIVRYTGDGGSPKNIPHLINKTPSLVMVKNIDENSRRWQVWCAGNNGSNNLLLSDAAESGYSSRVAGENLTSSLFQVEDSDPNGNAFVNKSGVDYIAYLWAEVDGFCKAGYYHFNGSANGPVVNCGFRPSVVWVKRIGGGTGAWDFWSDEEEPQNPMGKQGYIHASSASSTSLDHDIDFFGNGFQIKDTSSSVNTSTGSPRYFYIAWADTPQKFSVAY